MRRPRPLPRPNRLRRPRRRRRIIAIIDGIGSTIGSITITKTPRRRPPRQELPLRRPSLHRRHHRASKPWPFRLRGIRKTTGWKRTAFQPVKAIYAKRRGRLDASNLDEYRLGLGPEVHRMLSTLGVESRMLIPTERHARTALAVAIDPHRAGADAPGHADCA